MATDTAIKMARDIITYCVREIGGCVDQLTEEYTRKERERPEEDKIKVDSFQLFNDPIHGSVQLNSLETAIINTQEFYRLKDIKQLGATSHVYPGAVHTRFEHSIGVCHLAGEFVKHLTSVSGQKGLIGKEEEYCIRLAGLCHDLGHGPFSHLFESIKKELLQKEAKEAIEHEKISTLLFKKILIDYPNVLAAFVEHGLDVTHVEMVEDMIMPDLEKFKEKNEKKLYLYEIVANKTSGLDVDKWDYYARDCHYLGLKYEFDWRRCMTLSKVVGLEDGSRHIGFIEKEKNNINGMFRTRSVLHEKAYVHKTSTGIDMMIKDVLLLLGDVQLVQLHEAGELKLLTLKECLPQKKGEKHTGLNGFVCLSDSILNVIMFALPLEGDKSKKDEEIEAIGKARAIITRIMKRDIYKMIKQKTYPDDDEKQQLPTKEELEASKKILQGDLEDCEVHCAKISYASEKLDNPLENIYFFGKDSREEIPTINPEKEVKVSLLNTPKTTVEYKLRLYSKKRCSNEAKGGELRFDASVRAIMKKPRRSQ